MRNRRSKEKYRPMSGAWTSEDSRSSPDLNSEIENLFNTYTHQNSLAMGMQNPLLDTERTSDVTFLAGIEPDVWRIPGHKRLLADKNGVFEAMFFGPLAARAGDRTGDSAVVEITDVSGRAFDYFIRFLYNDDVEFQNVPSALEVLHVADKYLCTALIKKCVFYLDQHLSADNVLDVYCNVQIYADGTVEDRTKNQYHHLVPSAPLFEEVFEASQHISGQRRASLRENTSENRIKAQYKFILDLMQPGNESPETISRILNMLCYNCLLLIDSYASQIFACLQNVEYIVSVHTLYNIFSRPTLQVSDETTLYKFLNAFLTNTLKQLKIPISFANKRQFLTNASCDRLLFSIKYLRLANFDQFIKYLKENEKNNLFHPHEIDFLVYLRQNKSHLYMIAQNLSNTPLAATNNNSASCVDENSRNSTKVHGNERRRGSRENSWESFNLDYVDVTFLNEPRTNVNEVYLPLSLRSLPKIKPQDEATGQERIATCPTKEKRKFAEYVWTVLAFIFD